MPIQFLWGDEDYLIEREIKKIKKEILGDVVNDLNYRVVDNPSFSLFSELIRTNAMMFGDVVLIIKCPKYFLETKNKETLDEKQNIELIDGLQNVSDRVHLVLICPTPRGEGKKPDARKKLYKELVKIATVKEFQSYKNYEEYKLIPIVQKMAQEIELKINQTEISSLIQTVGASLRDISNQLEKLKLYAYPSNLVTLDMIEKVVCSNTDIFSLVDLILQKKHTKALEELSEILQKEHFLPILAFIQTTFTNLIKLKIYSKSYSSYDLSIKLNKNKFRIEKELEKIQNVSLDELVCLKVNLTNAEYQLKTGVLKDPLLAYETVFFDKGGM